MPLVYNLLSSVTYITHGRQSRGVSKEEDYEPDYTAVDHQISYYKKFAIFSKDHKTCHIVSPKSESAYYMGHVLVFACITYSCNSPWFLMIQSFKEVHSCKP